MKNEVRSIVDPPPEGGLSVEKATIGLAFAGLS
jgi:hypothetical protein